MKYLIDGMEKNVMSLASQYKYLKADDEFRVYDPKWSNIDGLDLVQSQNFYLEGGLSPIYNEKPDSDTRRFKMVTDFDKALDWCDCYVSFASIPYIYTQGGGTTESAERIEKMLERLEKAKSLSKKVYLGNRFSQEFIDCMDSYEGCLNKVVREDDLKKISKYSYLFQGATEGFNFHVSVVVGTNSASGKFSSAMKIKKLYEDLGERVVLFHTEETYPFLDDQEGTVTGFCRNFSELTTDQDLQYFQSLIAKTYTDKRPDRFIFITQSGFGTNGVINSYQDTNNGRKMKGLWDSFIVRSFGANELIVSCNWNTIDLAKNLIEYWKVNESRSNAIYLNKVYVNPVEYGGWDRIQYIDDEKTKFFKSSHLGQTNEVVSSIENFLLEYPRIDVYCDYGDVQTTIDRFKAAEDFKQNSLNTLAGKMIERLANVFDDRKLALDAVKAAVSSQTSAQ